MYSYTPSYSSTLLYSSNLPYFSTLRCYFIEAIEYAHRYVESDLYLKAVKEGMDNVDTGYGLRSSVLKKICSKPVERNSLDFNLGSAS